MSQKILKTRVAVDLRRSPESDAPAIASIPADTNLRIIARDNNWYFVSTTRGRNLIVSAFRDQRGYVPVEALILTEEHEIAEEEGPLTLRESAQELPAHIKAIDLRSWLEDVASEAPPWISEEDWQGMSAGVKVDFKTKRKAAIQQDVDGWNSWLTALEDNGRMGDALIGEWLAILAGGLNMFPIRAHTILPEPANSSGPAVWVNPDEVMLWSGYVRREHLNSSDTLDWYEVNIFKWNRENRGWFRGDLLEEYVAPSPENDPAELSNASKVFDLSAPILRAPQDIAIGSHPNAAQYIDVFPVIERHLTHVNLCGEFCAAALAEMDIFPFLHAWHRAYGRAEGILQRNQATFLIDVKAMIDVIGRAHEDLTFNPNRPLTARRLQERLTTGERLIAGVGIKHNGEVHRDGTIAHWVVVVHALPVGTSGWVRIYNPFHNREEVYPFYVFTAAQERLRAGLWVAAVD